MPKSPRERAGRLTRLWETLTPARAAPRRRKPGQTAWAVFFGALYLIVSAYRTFSEGHSFEGLPATVFLFAVFLAIVTGVSGRRGPESPTGRLLARLRSLHPAERAHAARDLGRLGEPRRAQVLIDALSDPDANVRLAVINALGELHAARAVTAIGHVVQQGSPAEVEAAARTLARIEGRKARLALLGILQDRGAPTEARITAASALGGDGEPVVVQGLAEALDDEETDLSDACARSLGAIGAGAVSALGALSRQQERRRSAAYAEAIRRIVAAQYGVPAELEAAGAPEGRGTELEATAPILGRGTEPEAADEPPGRGTEPKAAGAAAGRVKC